MLRVATSGSERLETEDKSAKGEGEWRGGGLGVGSH